MQQTIQVQISVTTDQFLLFQRLFAVNIHVFKCIVQKNIFTFRFEKKIYSFSKSKKKLKLKVMMIDETKKEYRSPTL